MEPHAAPAHLLWAVWNRVDACLAWLLGLDQPKYQWAMFRQAAEQREVGGLRVQG